MIIGKLFLINIATLLIVFSQACGDFCRMCQSSAKCNSCVENATNNNDGSCSCNLNFYDDGSGSCIECSNGFYYDSGSKVCLECPKLCKTCSSATICIECKNKAQKETSECVCTNGYVNVDNKCIGECPIDCKTCSSGSNVCTFCYDEKVYWADLNNCLTDCPSGFTVSSEKLQDNSSFNKCTLDNSSILEVSMKDLQIQYDLGNTKVYGVNVLPQYKRGWYFDGTAYATLPLDVIYNVNFSIEIWLRVDDASKTSTIISKYHDKDILHLYIEDSTLKLKASFSSFNDLSNASEENLILCEISSKQWTRLGIEFIYQDYDTTLNVYNQTQILNSITIPNKHFSDELEDFSLFTLGAYYKSPLSITQYFQGFIASFNTTNSKYSPSFSSDNCISPDFCISDCDLDSYPMKEGCGICKSSCKNGCANFSKCTQNIDPLCLSYSNFDACNVCEEYSYLKDGTCNCVDGSFYDPDSNSCVCSSEYGSYNGKCVLCRNYLNPTEISGAYSSDYYSIIISFTRRIKPTLIKTCSDLLNEDSLNLIGSKSVCKLSLDRFSATIILEPNSRFNLGSIQLNELNLVGEGKLCRYNPDIIEIDISINSIRPYINARLQAPVSYSTSCPDKSLLLNGGHSSGVKRFNLNYSWDIYGSGMIKGLTIKSEGSDKKNLIIEPSYLQPGVIYANLTVSNALGDIDYESKSIEIRQEKILDISIDVGQFLEVKSSDHLRLNAVSNNKCGSNYSVEYKWSVLSSTDPELKDSSSLLNTFGSILFINRELFKPGFSYSFHVDGDDKNGLTGYAETTVSFIFPELIISLNRVDSIISDDSDQVIDAKHSYDPLGYPLTFFWLCFKEGRTCTDSEYQPLQLGNSSLMSIPKSIIEPELNYEIELEVSTSDGRSKTQRVSFRAIRADSNSISITSPLKLSHQRPLLLNPVLDCPDGAIIEWKQRSGPSILSKVLDSIPLLQFSSDMLIEGENYHFELQILHPDLIGLASLLISVNSGPKPGSFSINPSKGVEFSTLFTFTADSYYDIDESDYPLTYSFTYKLKSDRTYSSRIATYSNSYTSVLSSLVKEVGVSVCDSIPTCIEDYQPVDLNVTPDRDLEDELLQKYIYYVENPDNIPGLSMLYLTSYSLNVNQTNFIKDTFLDYMNNNQDDLQTREVYYSFYRALLDQTDYTNEEDILELLDSCYTLMKNKTDHSLLESIEIYDIFYTYISMYASDTEFTAKAIDYLYHIFRESLQHEGPTSLADQVNSESYFKQRVFANDIERETITLAGLNVTVPEYIEDPWVILDVYIQVVLADPLPVFGMYISKAGIHENNNIYFQANEESSFISNFSIPFVYEFHWNGVLENGSSLVCRRYSTEEEEWQVHSCEIEIIEDVLQVKSRSTGIMKLEILIKPTPESPDQEIVEEDDCEIMVAPYVIVGTWFCVLALIWFVIVNIKGEKDHAYEVPNASSEYQETQSQNRSYRPKQNEYQLSSSVEEVGSIRSTPPSPATSTEIPTVDWRVGSYFNLYIIIEIFRKDTKMYCMIHLTNFMATMHLGFALLGTFIFAFTDSEDNSSDTISEIALKHYPFDTRYIFMALAIVIPVSLPGRFLVKVGHGVVDIILLITSLFILLGSIFGILLMGSYFCQAATTRWTLAYLIFIPLELLISEFIISLVLFVASKR